MVYFLLLMQDQYLQNGPLASWDNVYVEVHISHITHSLKYKHQWHLSFNPISLIK